MNTNLKNCKKVTIFNGTNYLRRKRIALTLERISNNIVFLHRR